MSKLRKHFLLIGSGGFFVFGFSILIIGSALPAIEKSLGIDHQQAGLIFATSSIGFGSSAFINMIFSKKLGPFRSLSIGISIVALSLFIFVFSRTFFLLLIANALLNFGTGLIEVNAAIGVSVLKEKKNAGILNFMHALYSLGALISPIVVSLFLLNVDDWYKPFAFAAIISTSLFAFSLILFKYDVVYEPSSTPFEHWLIVKEPLFWLIIAGVFLYVGYEVSFSSWLSAYSNEIKGIPLRISSAMPSFLWLGLLIGRLLSSVLSEKLGYSKLMLMLTSIATTLFITILFIKMMWIYIISIVIIGIGFSAMFPTLQATLIRHKPKYATVSASLFTVAAAAGAAIVNVIIGTLGKFLDLQYGMYFILSLLFAELFVVTLIYRKEKHETS